MNNHIATEVVMIDEELIINIEEIGLEIGGQFFKRAMQFKL